MEGVKGAFHASESDDIGSPGWLDDHPPPLFIEVQTLVDGLSLFWTTQVGFTYELLSASSLTEDEWDLVFRQVATETSMTTTVRYESGGLRLYQLRRLDR